MKFEIINDTKKICIQPAHLAMSELETDNYLDIHVRDKALVIIPQEMNAMELIRVVISLSAICNELMTHMIKECGHCSKKECSVYSEDCPYKDIENFEDLEIPDALRKLAGFDEDARLTFTVDKGILQIYEKDEEACDLSDIPEWVLKTFIALGGCPMELEEKLGLGEILYGDD